MADNEGVTDQPIYAEARPGELDRSCLDAGKARRELGWSPQVSLAEGVKATLDWTRSRQTERRPSGWGTETEAGMGAWGRAAARPGRTRSPCAHRPHQAWLRSVLAPDLRPLGGG